MLTDFTIRFDDDTIAGTPSKDPKDQLKFLVTLENTGNGYMDDMFYQETFDFGYQRKSASQKKFENQEDEEGDVDRGDFRGFIMT